MTVTTDNPVTLGAVTGSLTTANGPGILQCSGDPTTAGAVLSSDQWTDTAILSALTGAGMITPDPPPTA